MGKYRKRTQVYYKCDHHIVFTPKYPFLILEGMVKSLIEDDLQVIRTRKDVSVMGVNVYRDHIHLVCSIPPKVSVSEIMGIRRANWPSNCPRPIPI